VCGLADFDPQQLVNGRRKKGRVCSMIGRRLVGECIHGWYGVVKLMVFCYPAYGMGTNSNQLVLCWVRSGLLQWAVTSLTDKRNHHAWQS